MKLYPGQKVMTVRHKATGVYHLRAFDHGFITMDAAMATRHPDTEEVREQFTRHYPYELEFIPATVIVPPDAKS